MTTPSETPTTTPNQATSNATTTADAGERDQATLDQYIPKDRFDSVVKARREAERKAAELEAKLAETQRKAAEGETYRERVTRVEQERDAYAKRYEVYRAAAAHGFTDPDVVDGFEYAYGRVQGDDKPAFSDWMSGLVSEPDKAPAILRPHIAARGASAIVAAPVSAPVSAPAAQAQAQAQPKAQPAPNQNASAVTPPAPVGTVSAQQVQTMGDDQFREWYRAEAARRGWAQLPQKRNSP